MNDSKDYGPRTEWFPHDVNPVHVGEYEVRNRVPIHHNNRNRLVGRMFRYWDGKHWLTERDGNESVFGQHWTHEWRGLAVKPDAQKIADAMFEDAQRLMAAAPLASIEPCPSNPRADTAAQAPDTREANDLPRDYLDPEGIAFDFDGLGGRGKVVAWALAAIIIIAALSAWWAA